MTWGGMAWSASTDGFRGPDPFTTVAVILAETFVALPFYVIAVEGSMRGLDPRLESVARTLGASDLRYLRTVALPLVLPGIASGAALAWARALGSSGPPDLRRSFPGRTQTAPLAVYAAASSRTPIAISLSIALLAVSILVLGTLREVAPMTGGSMLASG